MSDKKDVSGPSTRANFSTNRFRKVIADPHNVVLDGYMPVSVADDILSKSAEAWGINTGREEARDLLLGLMAQVLVYGTSAERKFDEVFINYEGTPLCMQVFATICAQHYHKENAVRVWARSYKHGEFAVRTHEMLGQPENTSLRQAIAYDAQCAIESTKFCFDYADAMFHFEGMNVTSIERYIIANNTANKVRTARSLFVGGTEGGTVSGLSDSVASGKADAPASFNRTKAAAAAPASFNDRLGFASVR